MTERQPWLTADAAIEVRWSELVAKIAAVIMRQSLTAVGRSSTG